MKTRKLFKTSRLMLILLLLAIGLSVSAVTFADSLFKPLEGSFFASLLQAPESVSVPPLLDATVTTDKTGYYAGEDVVITGSGFAPFENVVLQVTHADGSTEPGGGHDSFMAIADGAGGFTASWPMGIDSAGNFFTLNAAGAASLDFNRIATVQTDKYDYQPGETAVITGAGFNPGETVTVQVVHSNGMNNGNGHLPFSASASENGDISIGWYVDPDDSLDSIFRLTASGTASGLVATSTFTDVLVTVVDDRGPDDPTSGAQTDLNSLSFNPGLDSVAITWNWDDTSFGNLGGNTGDACSLVDTDANGFADYAFCVIVDGNPAGQITNKLYSCGDTRADRCDQPTNEILSYTSTSTASVVPNSDPFVGVGDHNDNNDCVGSNCLTADTVANVTLQLADVGGAAVAKVLNVCTYPAGPPNSNPSDCVFAPNNGFLTIVKSADPDDDTAFTFNLGAGQTSTGGASSWNINGSGSVQLISFAPGTTYDLNEAVPAGWKLDSASCAIQTSPVIPTGTPDAPPAQIGPTSKGVQNFEIRSGLETVCTFNDSLSNGSLTVIKHVVNDNGGTSVASNFTMNLGGTTATSFAGAESPGTTTSFVAGTTFNVTETGPTGYTASFSGDCSGTITAGVTKTCTITNDDQPGTLIVNKVLTQDNGGTEPVTSFSYTVNGGSSIPFEADSSNSATVNAGTYTVAENAASGYTTTYNNCAGVVVSLGETETCTITNDDIPARLRLQKTVINDNGGTLGANDFLRFIDGNAVAWNTFVNVAPGVQHTASETTLAGYSASAWGGDCAAAGTVTIPLGQDRTCTITNNDIQPRLIVIKHVINDNGGTAVAGNFTMTVTGTSMPNPGPTPNSFPGAESPGTNVALNAGTVHVDEIMPMGPQAYAKSYSGACDSSGNVTVGIGQTKTCIVTNDDLAQTLVTSSSLCTYDVDSGTPGNQFRLVFTPDITTSGVFKLNATNPGQTFYNVFYAPTSPAITETIYLKIPWPYVTQGATPIHVYGDDTVVQTVNGQQCITPGTGISSAQNQIVFGSPNYDGFGDVATVPVTFTWPVGETFVYINIHLDYGLKRTGPYTRNLTTNDAIGNGTTTVNIMEGQSYPFNAMNSVPLLGHTVYSTNAFKKNPGAGGMSQLVNNNGAPIRNAQFTLKKGNQTVATGVSDDDGWYQLLYKHTGKAADFTILMSNVAGKPGYTQTKVVTLKANAYAQVDFYVPQ